ncbi:MAG: aminotransferase class III-fold pyridoxal phosphate-dependent enzyme [Planctomycetes bacterium]|nr:aminotransferase class III-fold pyridoxal phosphate-dependent enzyme [Planctomycetota bacterium]
MDRGAPDAADFARTAELVERARALFAYGGLDGIVERPLLHEDGAYPQFAASARGAEFTDTCGRTYVDWVNGWGPVILGYRHPEVEAAIRAQFDAGPTLSLMHPLELAVAERIARLVPCAERVAFGKNGSDVVGAAVRLARACTGRERIAQYGFHGFHDWYVCMLPGVRGVPRSTRELVTAFPYGDLGALERLLAKRDVAAVVMEPVREIWPPSGYLEGVRELCTRHGTLLVFDEIVTAFRIAKGGAQERFGVVPDLACVGKALANGLPLSALVGKREFMRVLPETGYGMTFRGETFSLAAANATLAVIERDDVPAALARIGERARTGFRALTARHGVFARLAGPPQRMTFEFHERHGVSPMAQRELFLLECLRHGVFTNGNLLASAAHDDTALERTFAGFDAALAAVARALADGAAPVSRAAHGIVHGFIEALDERPRSPAPDHAARDAGSGRAERSGPDPERVRDDPERANAGAGEVELYLDGWLLLADGAPDELVARGPGGVELACARVARPDLASAHPTLVRPETAGFSVALPAEGFADATNWDVTLVARRAGRAAFHCRVLRRRAVAVRTGPHSMASGAILL